jgi:predicted dehydrogenase
MISIGIVGCGIGGNAVLRSIHNLTDVNVIGVSDPASLSFLTAMRFSPRRRPGIF